MKDTNRADHRVLARSRHRGTPISPAGYALQFNDSSGV